MLSNAYFLAKFRFDTAENEPAKNLQKFANFATLIPILATPCRARRCPADLPGRPAAPDVAICPALCLFELQVRPGLF